MESKTHEQNIIEKADGINWDFFVVDQEEYSEEFLERFKDKITNYRLNGKLHSYKGRPSYISTEYSMKTWHKNGLKHREDGPAVIYEDGDYEWYLNGNKHREDGPACKTDGMTEWYINGKNHRIGGPAVTYDDGDEEWFENGVYHRIDGPALNHPAEKRFEWFINGKLHREDGPAIIREECGVLTEEWYINGMKHREDGPAEIRYVDGDVISREYFLNNQEYESMEDMATMKAKKIKEDKSFLEKLFDNEL